MIKWAPAYSKSMFKTKTTSCLKSMKTKDKPILKDVGTM